MSLMPAPGPRLRMAPRLERLVAKFSGRMGCAKEPENQAISMGSPYRLGTDNEK